MADRIEGLRTKHAKKSERLSVEFHEYCSCAFVSSNLPNNDSDWPVSKYNVKLGRHAAPCIAPHCATRWIALREALTHCSVVVDELFVYQSLYLSTLVGVVCKIARTWVKSHLDAQNLIHFYTAVKWLYLSIKERYMALVGSTSSIHKIYQWIKSYNIIYTPCSTCSAKK